MTFKWHRVSGNKQLGISEDGDFSLTCLPDYQYIVRYRTPNTNRAWTWVMGATGKREFDTQDEVLEEAQKERIKYFNGYEPYHPARALKNLEP